MIHHRIDTILSFHLLMSKVVYSINNNPQRSVVVPQRRSIQYRVLRWGLPLTIHVLPFIFYHSQSDGGAVSCMRYLCLTSGVWCSQSFHRVWWSYFVGCCVFMDSLTVFRYIPSPIAMIITAPNISFRYRLRRKDAEVSRYFEVLGTLWRLWREWR